MSSEDVSVHRRDVAALRQADRFLAVFSHTAAIGFGICDLQLRYLFVNDVLAASNGILAEAHVGRTVREILGKVAPGIELAFRKALYSGEPVCKEIVGNVPGRVGRVSWIACYFAVKNRTAGVQQLGAIAVEVTELKKLNKFWSEVASNLDRTGTNSHRALAQELHESMGQYFTALAANLNQVTRNFWDLDKSADEQIAPIIESLDKRIVAVRNVASEVARLDRQ
jgi:signal transduction histidine kinase